jgi:predicted esterase
MRLKKLLLLLLTIALGILIPVSVYLFSLTFNPYLFYWKLTGRLQDQGTYLVYLPKDLPAGQKVPLVFALSPSADANSLILTWAGVAERHHWIIAASTQYRNFIDFAAALKQNQLDLNDALRRYPADPARVIFTGLSGGGSGSHAMAKFYSDQVAAVVINTGMLYDGLNTPDYPNSKLAVFLASPTDFRYTEMQRDRLFLESHQWKTLWLEFEGGHTLAPPALYEQAAAWLEEQR